MRHVKEPVLNHGNAHREPQEMAPCFTKATASVDVAEDSRDQIANSESAENESSDMPAAEPDTI